MDKKILLIADDVEMSRKVIQRFFQADYEILEAADGKEALACLQSRHVDVLLLDIVMPGMDGLQVLEKLRADETTKNIAVLVASSTKEDTERMALSLGADDVVSKPYDPIVIKQRLRNVLAAREAMAQRDMLKTANLTALLNEHRSLLQHKLDGSAAALCQLADIIAENLDNPELLAQSSEQLRHQADQLKRLLADPEV